MTSLLSLDNFHPMIDEFERERKRRIIVYGFSHSLRSASQLASAMEVNNDPLKSAVGTASSFVITADRRITLLAV